MADITEFVTVTVLGEGQLAERDNMNICCVVSSELGYLNSARRTARYKTLSAVSSDFATNTEIYKHAAVFFSQQPNPVNANGDFVAAYWRAASENVAASSASLTSGDLSEDATVAELQAISDGSFDIDIDGLTENITALDFTEIDDFDDAVDVLNAALAGGTASLSEDRKNIVITSDTTGVTSLITYVTDPGSGTYLGNLLSLASGTGAALVQGSDASVLGAESKIDAVTAIRAEVNVKGMMFVDPLLTADINAIAADAQANDYLFYETFTATTDLVKATSDAWTVKLAGQTNFRCLLDLGGQRTFATAYMARAHVVNFNGENTALTMNGKELVGILPYDYTDTQINSAYAIGFDIYITIKNTPVLKTSPKNDFMDNRYNLLAYVDALQTDLFNLLKQPSTKVPQTEPGVRSLVDQCEKTTRLFVRAGFLAPGTWSSPIPFGNVDTFNRAIQQNGFYFLPGRLSDQPQVDRQNRLSPVLQGAIKNAGAIHKADIIINFNL